jgi:hypothetical protein
MVPTTWKTKMTFASFERFHPQGEHDRLDGQRRQDEKVVAGERRALRIEQVRADQEGQHECAEQARPALLNCRNG